MSGISVATGILAARRALFAAIKAAFENDRDVDKYFGMPDVVQSRAWAGIGDLTTEFDPRTVGQRGQGDETITFEVSLGAWVPGHRDDTADKAFDRAFGLLATLQTYITQEDITLGGAVLWCLPGSVRNGNANDEDGSGYVCELVAEFVCLHRVRPR